MNETQIKEIIVEFNSWLIANRIIKTESIDYYSFKMQKKFQDLVFKTIGYSPGKCNIGSQERRKRLILGLISGIIAFIEYIFLSHMNYAKEIRFLLFLPFWGFFIGIYQYFFRFCVANGISKNML